MLNVRENDVGKIYLYNNEVLLTYHKAKQEISIPAAKIKIYASDEYSKLFLKPAFVYSKYKRWDDLVASIIVIGGDYAFRYRTATGFLDPSVKQSEIDMGTI